MIKEICTERLILTSNWQDEFAKPFMDLNNDLQVMEYFPKTLNLEEVEAFIGKIKLHFLENSFGLLACQLKENGEFIGFVGLNKIDFEAHFTPAIEIGWRLASKYWGNGYATEAAKACLKVGFNELGLDEIVAITVLNNKKSTNVMEKIGMVRDLKGDFNHPKLPADHPLSLHVLYKISKNQFLENNTKSHL